MNTERDGGYAWVILGATWLNNVLWAGVYSSSSVYMLEWLEVFDTGKAGMGMVGGTQNGINFFSGNAYILLIIYSYFIKYLELVLHVHIIIFNFTLIKAIDDFIINWN